MKGTMTEYAEPSWENAQAILDRWHEDRRPALGRALFGFLEIELRLMIPPLIRRSWPEDLVEDALREFLMRLIEQPLPDGIGNLRAYLRRSFGNHCTDCFRARERRPESPLEPEIGDWEVPSASDPSPLEVALRREREGQLHAALARLAIADRVVLKLEFAPEWLDAKDAGWLAERAGLSTPDLRDAIAAADGIHALTRLFDPGDDDSNDTELRRKRMERFRRRRARARDKLHELLQETNQ